MTHAPEDDQERDPLDLSAEQEAKALKAEAIRFQRQLEIDDLKWMMAHKQGRRIAWRLLEQYGVFRMSFTDNPLITAFNEGARNHGLKLMADIHEHTPERYAEMLKEQKEHGRRNRSTSNGNSGTGS